MLTIKLTLTNLLSKIVSKNCCSGMTVIDRKDKTKQDAPSGNTENEHPLDY